MEIVANADAHDRAGSGGCQGRSHGEAGARPTFHAPPYDSDREGAERPQRIKTLW